MKKIILLPFFAVLIFTNYAFTQQFVNNDDCGGAFSLTVAADADSAFLFIGTTSGATTSTVPTAVCSGSWFGDDVWYEFTTDSIVPPNGVTIKILPNLTSSFQGLGMAVYTSCDSAASYINCFSQNGSLDSMNLPYLEANTTYKVRVWSGGGVTTNSGAYHIIIYENAFQSNVPLDVVLWGDSTGQGDFNGGMNGWTSIVDSLSTNPTDHWIWEADAQANSMFHQNAIESPTAYNGAMLFDADFMTTSVNPNPVGPPYPQHTADLLSPIIDCSGMPPLSVKFYQSYEALNGDCYFSYSIDSGATFSTPININDDISDNEGTTASSIKRYSLPNANGNHIQLKFTADMDFYNWIIDDVQLIEKEKNNIALVEDFIAVAPQYSMPFAAIDTIRFLADVANIGVNNATNVVLSVDVVSDIGGDTVFSATNYYGTIAAGDTIKNQPFTSTFFPDIPFPFSESYTATYTLSSDSTDFFPLDNRFSFPFKVDYYFRKALPMVSEISPYLIDTANAFSFGTTFYVGAIEAPFSYIPSVGFSVANPDELAGESVTIFIEKPSTGNEFIIEPDGKTILFANRTIEAFGTYTFTGNEPSDEILYIPIEDFSTAWNFYPDSNMNYIVALNHVSSSSQGNNLAMNVSRAVDYSTTEVAAELSGVQQISTVLDIGGTGDYDISGVEKNVMPILEVYYAIPWSTQSPKLNPNTLKISPNPATDFIKVNIELEEFTKKATMIVYNIQGQVVATRSLSNIKNETVLFDLNDYGSGTYSVLIETENGHVVKRFVVAK